MLYIQLRKFTSISIFLRIFFSWMSFEFHQMIFLHWSIWSCNFSSALSKVKHRFSFSFFLPDILCLIFYLLQLLLGHFHLFLLIPSWLLPRIRAWFTPWYGWYFPALFFNRSHLLIMDLLWSSCEYSVLIEVYFSAHITFTPYLSPSPINPFSASAFFIIPGSFFVFWVQVPCSAPVLLLCQVLENASHPSCPVTVPWSSALGIGSSWLKLHEFFFFF